MKSGGAVGRPTEGHTKLLQEASLQRDSTGVLHDSLGMAKQVAHCYGSSRRFEPRRDGGVKPCPPASPCARKTWSFMWGRDKAGATRRDVALAPALARYAPDKLAREAEIQKQRRKAQEETAAKSGKKGQQNP